MRRIAVALVAPLVLAACGSELTREPPIANDELPGASEPAPLYEVSTTVLEDRSHGPMLCLGVMLMSLPPQCGDVPLTNWDGALWTARSGCAERFQAGTTSSADTTVRRSRSRRSGPSMKPSDP